MVLCMQGLWVHGNLLSSVSDSLAGLTALRQLSLSGNCISTLPDQLFHGMTHLTEFVAAGNQLTKVQCVSPFSPPLSAASILTPLSHYAFKSSMAHMAVREFEHGSGRGGQPGCLLACPPHLACTLPWCWWVQQVPSSLGAATALIKLALNGNRLKRLPSLEGLGALKELWLQGNQLQRLPDLQGLQVSPHLLAAAPHRPCGSGQL
ncbi:uncharacterized protein HaLaN_31851 [Haematococcus lacustris]|uniref:Uncharacterized protein n=1 Tax=Haematococcus lacustris TaxID=44745 RepID=A0A6A0AIN0_HAELA|nr:uncharacterized protein HaLaN_31851 [Haematococcus lacustris]